MGWFILGLIFSNLLAIVGIGLLSQQEKGPDILIPRWQLDILQSGVLQEDFPIAVSNLCFISSGRFVPRRIILLSLKINSIARPPGAML